MAVYVHDTVFARMVLDTCLVDPAVGLHLILGRVSGGRLRDDLARHACLSPSLEQPEARARCVGPWIGYIEAAISRFSLWTVPVPKPVKRATLPMPTPLASSCRARSICVSAPGRPSACAQYLLRSRSGRRAGSWPNTEAGVQSLSDHAALEFEEAARYLEEQLAGRRRRTSRKLEDYVKSMRSSE